jgi:hypothetical protein
MWQHTSWWRSREQPDLSVPNSMARWLLFLPAMRL